MSTSPTTPQRRPQVFISYANSDRDIARRLSTALSEAGLSSWSDSWELSSGDSIVERISTAIASSDILIVLLSPESVSSKWVGHELATALSSQLRDRAVTVVPALLKDCEIPPLLADRVYFDLRTDLSSSIRRLVDQVSAIPHVDFSSLNARDFEKLVGDLLSELGFVVQASPLTRDGGFDLSATYRSKDPFGAEQIETWLVEVKHYREQRASISALRQLIGALMTSSKPSKGLLVTNSRLTSEARSFLSETKSRHDQTLRVLDGTELTNLLLQHPKLVRKYFASADHHE